MSKVTAVYTSGPIGTRMIRTAFAMLAGTLSMSGYNLADTYFIGRLEGSAPLAAMGFSLPVIMLIGCIFHGLGNGIMAITAQALGGNKKERASGFVSAGLLLVAIISVILAVVGMTTCRDVFVFFGAQGEALQHVQSYMDIWYFGCFSAALSMAGNSLLIGVGDNKAASFSMMGGMIINVILDPVFIFGWGSIPAMGIKGAVLATIGSQICVMCFNLQRLNRKHHLLRFAPIPLKRLLPCWGMTLRYGIPAMLGMLMMPIASVVITKVTAVFGDAAVAATAAAGRLEMVAFVFPMALGMTLVPMIGQNYGAKLYDRIRDCHRFAMRFAFCYLLVLGVLYVAFAPQLVRLFSTDAEVCRIMAHCMYIIPWGFAAIEIHRYGTFFYTGCGRPNAAAWLNALRILGLMIPLTLLALVFGQLWLVFAARLAADVISGSVSYLLSKRLIARLR